MKQIEKFITQLKLVFIVFGDIFDPNDFTKKIGISPSNTWVKGDSVTSHQKLKSNRVSLKRKESAWEFSIDFIETLDFGDLSKQFVNKFESKLDLIKKYVEKNNLETTLNVVVEIANGETPSLNLSKEFVSMMNHFGAEVDFDVYVLEDE